jgi:L-fuconolactonase
VLPAEHVVAMMDAAGVAAAVLVSPSLYGWDPSYAFEVATRYPGRFGVVGPVDPAANAVADTIAGWRERTGGLGVRVVILSEAHEQRLRSGGFEPVFEAAERHGVPTFLFTPRLLHVVAHIASEHPGLQLVVDHLGLAQPPLMQPDPEPFGDLPALLALAQFENVAVKCSGVPTLSSEPYPFADLWPHLHQVLEAFGVERVMWGSDITRVQGMHTYEEAIGYIRDTAEISAREKAALLGQTLRRLLRWPAP